MRRSPRRRGLRSRGLRPRDQLERELELTRALAGVTSGALLTVDAALEASLEIVCRATEWNVGQAWMVGVGGEKLRCRAAWTSEPGFEPFLEASETAAFELGRGLPGLAWASETVVWVADYAQERSLPHHLPAVEAGLVSAVAIPLFAGEEVTGVLEFLVVEARERDEELADLISAAATQIGPLIRLKEAHERLEESELRFRATAETAADAIVSADFKGRISYFNRAAERIFGYSPAQVIGRPITVLMPERYHGDHRAGLRRFATTGESRLIGRATELEGRRADGTEFPLELSLGTWDSGEKRHVTGIIRDISERRLTEARLLEREAQLAEAQSLARLGSWEWEPGAAESQWSDELFRLYGLEPRERAPTVEEAMGAQHPDDRERVRAAWEGALSEHEPFSFLHRVVGADGKVRTLHSRGKPIFDNGSLVRFIGTGQDVTEREDEIGRRREAEVRFRTAFANAPIGICLKDPDGRFIDINTALCELMGYSVEKLRGKTFLNLLHPDERADSEDAWEQLVRGQRSGHQAERRYRHQDGRWVRICLTEASVLNDAGQVQYVIAHWEDITQKRQAENALKESRERLQAIVDHTPTSIFMKDLEGRYVLVNNQAAAILGAQPEDVVGKTDHDLLPKDVADNIRAHDRQVHERGAAVALEEEVPGIEGPVRVLTEKFPIRDEAGSVYAVCGISTDITERVQTESHRRKLEAELQEARRLELAGRLAGGMAHDFNNLLAIILNYAHLAGHQTSEGSSLRHDIGEMRRAAEQAAELTQGLLAFSRQQPTSSRSLRLNQIVERADGLLRQALSADVELRVELADELWPVEVDGTQLERVLVNLGINASDAMPQGGSVTLGADNVAFEAGAGGPGLMAPGRYVRLRVSDTGVGMTEEVAARAFDPFFTTKPTGRGTGLGLATVQGVMAQMRGAVGLDSRPGEGTSVILHLPVSEREPESYAMPPEGEPPMGHDEVVLLVEDEAPVRRSVARIITDGGYRVEEAETPERALELCADAGRHFDLVLSDVVMPSMSGPKLVERLHLIRPDLGVILMSGYPEDVKRRHGFNEDWPCLSKPFTPAELLHCVGQIVQERSARA